MVLHLLGKDNGYFLSQTICGILKAPDTKA